VRNQLLARRTYASFAETDLWPHREQNANGRVCAIVNIKVIHWPSKTDPLALV
jgi:hypothetical protein